MLIFAETFKTIHMESISEVYQEFFSFMHREHGLILVKSQIDDILHEARKLDEKLSKGLIAWHHFDCIYDEEYNIIGYEPCSGCGLTMQEVNELAPNDKGCSEVLKNNTHGKIKRN